MLSAVINFEHMADIVCNGIMEIFPAQPQSGPALGARKSRSSCRACTGELMACTLTLAVSLFLQPNPVDAHRLVASKGSFRTYESRATALNVKRLRTIVENSRGGGGESAERLAEESGLLLRLVRDLRRNHSHLVRFAYPALNRRKLPRRPNQLTSQDAVPWVR